MSFETCLAILSKGFEISKLSGSKEVICDFLASVFYKEELKVNDMVNWNEKQWCLFFVLHMDIVLKNCFKPGSVPLLVHALRNTADGVQTFLDTKKISQAPKDIENLKEEAVNSILLLVVPLCEYETYLKIRNETLSSEVNLLEEIISEKIFVWTNGKTVKEEFFTRISEECLTIHYIKLDTKPQSNGFNILAENWKQVLLKSKGQISAFPYHVYVEKNLLNSYKTSIYPEITLSRSGIKRNHRKSSFSRISYEAPRISYINEAKAGQRNTVDLVSSLLFGLPLKVGTGFNFSESLAND